MPCYYNPDDRKEMNHSKAFWSEVEKVLPDYKAHVKWLKDEVQLINVNKKFKKY